MTLFEIKERELADSIIPEVSISKIRVGDYDINYAKVGIGYPVILIHGVNIGWGQWHLNIAEFAKHFTVYAIDLPGSGGSTKINFSSLNLEKDFVNTVRSTISSLNLMEYHLVGHSTGAWIGLRLAMEGRVNKMILVNPLGLSQYMPWRYRPMSIPLFANIISKTVMRPSRENMKNFLQSVLYEKHSLNDTFIDYFYESVNKDMITHPLMLISRLSGFFKMKNELVLTRHLSRVGSSTLVIVGDKDPLIPLDLVRESISSMPSARLEVFSETGHVALLEKFNKFNEMVVEFLNR